MTKSHDQNYQDFPPDYYKTTKQIVEEAGFEYSESKVETEDHYVLAIMRVKQPGLKKGAPVVFLQHGLLDSSFCWMTNGPKNSPAFILANQGYDVWLGNKRGNKYSRENTVIDPDVDKA